MHLKLLSVMILGISLWGCGDNATSTTDIPTNSASKPQRKLLDPPKLEEGHALVYTSNGSKQCESGSDAPETTAKRLTDKGIDVISSHCGDLTGIMYPAVCGGGTGQINLHAINSQNIPDAKNIGFAAVSDLHAEFGEGFQVIECP